MYKSLQQFRTFGSTKRGVDRYKYLDGSSIRSSDNRGEFIKMLNSSLVTNTKSCRILEYNEPIRKIWDGECGVLTEEEMEIIGELSFIKDGSYELLEVKDRLVPLKRKISTYCKVHERIHEAENPFLTFTPDSTKIYLHCRRPPEGKELVWNRPIVTEIDPPIKNIISGIKKEKGFLKKFLGK